MSKNSITPSQKPPTPKNIYFQIWIICQFVKKSLPPPPPPPHNPPQLFPLSQKKIFSKKKFSYSPSRQDPPPPSKNILLTPPLLRLPPPLKDFLLRLWFLCPKNALTPYPPPPHSCPTQTISFFRFGFFANLSK